MSTEGQKVFPFESRSAFVISLLVSFVIIFGVACIVAYQSYMKAIDATIRSNETKATLLSRLILEHQRAAIGVLQSYAHRPLLVDSVEKRDFEGALRHLIDLAKHNPEMDWPFLSNPDSTVWVNYPVDRQVMNKDLSYRDWYKGVKKEWKPYISSVYKLLVGEKDLAVAISAPILDEKGKVIGILSTAQSTALFRKIIGEVGLNLDAKITLIDQEGHIIYSNGSPYTKEIVRYPLHESVAKAMKGEKGDVKVRDPSDGDRVKYVSFAPLGGIGWSILVEKTRSGVFRSELSSLVLIGVISLLIFGVVALFLIHSRERHRHIKGLERLNEELDDRVRERTAELEALNETLGESEQRWATTLASIGDAVISTDLSGNITFMNKIAEELTGWTLSEASTKPVAGVFHIINEHTRNRVEDPVAKVLKEGVIVGLPNHTVLVGKSRREIPIDDSGAPIRDGDGRLMGVVLVFRDITERKRAEEALRESEARRKVAEAVEAERKRLYDVLETLPAMICLLTPDYHVAFANRSFREKFGESGGRHCYESCFGRTGPCDFCETYKVFETGKPHHWEVKTPDGAGVIDVHDFPFTDVDGSPLILEMDIDITEHRRTETALKERTAELADLSSQLVSAQENERRQVSYDLHDNAWQALVAVRFEIERLFSDQDGMDWAALQDKAKKVMATILDTVGKIRSMQGDLWPYVLDDIGIVATIDWYCREFEKNHSGLAIERKNDLAESKIPSSAKIVIYRILQETLNNVAKHSRAGHVTIRLIKKDHGMEFIVQDDGIGFDPEEAIARRAPWGGLGLLSIKARTELSGGLFGVDSAKGKGTTVRATWPLA